MSVLIEMFRTIQNSPTYCLMPPHRATVCCNERVNNQLTAKTLIAEKPHTSSTWFNSNSRSCEICCSRSWRCRFCFFFIFFRLFFDAFVVSAGFSFGAVLTEILNTNIYTTVALHDHHELTCYKTARLMKILRLSSDITTLNTEHTTFCNTATLLIAVSFRLSSTSSPLSCDE